MPRGSTKLDKIKNLHPADSIATENCGTRGRWIWMPACKITGTDNWLCGICRIGVVRPFSDGAIGLTSLGMKEGLIGGVREVAPEI